MIYLSTDGIFSDRLDRPFGFLFAKQVGIFRDSLTASNFELFDLRTQDEIQNS